LIPFGAGIWEKIYYKFYELGNNGFYIPSMAEQNDEDDESTNQQSGEDINVEG